MQRERLHPAAAGMPDSWFVPRPGNILADVRLWAWQAYGNGSNDSPGKEMNSTRLDHRSFPGMGNFVLQS